MNENSKNWKAGHFANRNAKSDLVNNIKRESEELHV